MTSNSENSISNDNKKYTKVEEVQMEIVKSKEVVQHAIDHALQRGDQLGIFRT